jgi:CheY-like chemotaxis protein
MTKRILIVDDEDDIREVAQMSLETIGGWLVECVATPEEGIVAAAERKPDAILLDVMMPGIDGPTALGKLRSRFDTRDIPVLFLTAKVQPSDREQLQGLGADGLVPKPFDPMTLSADIAATLGWSD